MYDTSSAGHIPAGVEPMPSALRELSEELGITAASADLKYAGTFRIQYEKEFHGRMFRDNELTGNYGPAGRGKRPYAHYKAVISASPEH